MKTVNFSQGAPRHEAAPPLQPDAASFRLRLQAELVRRCKANPQYSIRAFARFLGVESSRLSKILRGERPVGAKLLAQFSQRLGLSPAEMSRYQAEDRRRSGGALHGTARTYLELSQDTFETIEDWRHYAILELMKVAGFRPEMRWISRRLGASVAETRACVERLTRVGLLEVLDDGSWHDKSEGFSSHILGENQTTAAHRRFQAELLRRAIEAIENVPIERRDQSSMMMATHSSKMNEAKKRIKEFRRELTEFLEDCEEKDSVYQLAVSIFPLTVLEKEKP
ncbi:MAG: TIGR02147 family protein [Bdellovibrionales bacterium]|nr:TIGR02147 family protein [Bdellovibrionales bacterium]